MAANLYEAKAATSEYFALKQENERLTKENRYLRGFLKSNFVLLPLKRFKRNDTLYKQQYSYFSAKTVNSTVNRQRNFLTLNIGSEQGVQRDMGVMTGEGIVGIVTAVSPNFCTVMSLLHQDMRINCQLKREASYGPLIWDGQDYRYCHLTDIPVHAKIKQGDTVITSEFSGIFPQGIMVGTVESFEKKEHVSFFDAKVKLSADLKKVNHVYIIDNKFKQERDSLEQRTQREN